MGGMGSICGREFCHRKEVERFGQVSKILQILEGIGIFSCVSSSISANSKDGGVARVQKGKKELNIILIGGLGYICGGYFVLE